MYVCVCVCVYVCECHVTLEKRLGDGEERNIMGFSERLDTILN